jgi:hypothetical protein
MSKQLQKHEKNSLSLVGQTVKAVISVKTSLEVSYSAANRRGRFRQLEADIICEYEVGLPPRRGSLAQ